MPNDTTYRVADALLESWVQRPCERSPHPCHWDCNSVRAMAAELLALRQRDKSPAARPS